MKHSILRKLLLIALLLTGSHAFAYDFEVDGIYYNITSSTDKTVEVTFAGDYYYSDFYEYTGNVMIPKCVTYNGATYSVTSIGDYAFSSCYNLTNVMKPNSVTTIRDGAFSMCDGLKSVTLGNSVTTIGVWAFKDCAGLTSVTIPNSVTSIDEEAFGDCLNLTSITIGNYVTSIAGNAFNETMWYHNQPDGILYLDKYCLGYKGNEPTGTLNLRDDTRLIANNAFQFCNSLKSVTIGNSVTSIGESAFSMCDGLKSVTIGNSVTTIGISAFSSCDGLKSVISLNPTPPTCRTNVFANNVYMQSIPLTVPSESVSTYKSANTWKDFTNIIGNDFLGVEETLADEGDAPAEYYVLNGVRVLNPEKGVYIKRKGDKTLKVIL